MPGRLDDRFDHWGFFNNFGTRYSVSPELGFNDGGSRQPNLDMTKLGVLNKIIYPTGGSTIFNYELNTTFGTTIRYATFSQYSAGSIIDIENLQPPFETQYLEIPFVIPHNYVPDSVKIHKYVNAGPQTTTNFVNIYITDEYNNPVNLTETIDLTHLNSGTNILYYLSNFEIEKVYKLHITGIGDGLGSFIYWRVKNGEDIIEEKNYDVGGLRIKEIQNFANSAPVISNREFYEYNDKEFVNRSSGKVIAQPRYSYSETKSFPFCFNNTYSAINNVSANAYSYNCRNSRNMLPLAGLNGYHIMYDNVRKYNENNKSNGFIDYKYSFVGDDSSYRTIITAPTTSRDFFRGDLLEQSFYRKEQISNSYKLIKKILNNFI